MDEKRVAGQIFSIQIQLVHNAWKTRSHALKKDGQLSQHGVGNVDGLIGVIQQRGQVPPVGIEIGFPKTSKCAIDNFIVDFSFGNISCTNVISQRAKEGV